MKMGTVVRNHARVSAEMLEQFQGFGSATVHEAMGERA